MNIADRIYVPSEEKDAVKVTRPVPEWGKMSDLLWICQFMCRYWDSESLRNPNVVYIGTQISSSISALSEMFPDARWHIYPGSPSSKSSDRVEGNVHYYSHRFAPDDIAKFKELNKSVLLICNLRTATGPITRGTDGKRSRSQIPQDIIQDMKDQEYFYKSIDPAKACLKFVASDKTVSMEYLFGVVFLKPFMPIGSKESVIVPEKDLVSNWNIQSYFDSLSWIDKQRTLKIPNDYNDDSLPEIWDTSYMLGVFSDYIKKISGLDNKEMVKNLFRYVVNKISGERYETAISTKINTPKRLSVFSVSKRPMKWRNKPCRIISNVIDGKSFNIIQEGIMIGGSKERAIYPFVFGTNYGEYVYAGPSQGFAVVALSKACRDASSEGKKVRCTLFVDSFGKESYQIRMARKYGASIKSYGRGYGSKLKERMEIARNYVSRSNDSVMVEFGASGIRSFNNYVSNMRDAISSSVKDYQNRIKRLWLTSGSGTTLKALNIILPNTHFMVLEVGKTIYDDIIDTKRWTKFDKTSISNLKFYEDVSEKLFPPFDSVPNYDAKIWRVFLENFKEDDFLLNIASIPGKSRPMIFDGSKKAETLS